MAKSDKPHAGHEGHLCCLQEKGFIDVNLEGYMELVRTPGFVCRKCGRVAKSADSLCDPEQI